MSRLPLVSLDDLSREQRAQYDRFPSNLTRGLLITDQRLSQALPNLANALRASSLDGKVREAVILRVAALHANAYERMQHIEQVREVGWSEEDIAAIEGGNFPAEIAPVLNFVDACVRDGDVSDPIFDTVATAFPPRDVVTLILLVGHYMMIARFTTILRIELDARPDSWKREH